MKRYIIIAVTVALLVTSLLYLPENAKPVIAAGTGNGENSEIVTIKDFDELLEFFTQNNEGALHNTAQSLMSSRAKDNDDDNDLEPHSKHSSVTLAEDTYIDSVIISKKISNYDYENGNHSYQNIGVTTVKMNRSLTAYITEDESYYVSKGYYKIKYEDYEDNEKSYSSSLVFDMQLYVDNESTVMKFNAFQMDMEPSEENIDLSSIIGKWVETPREFAYTIFSIVDRANRDTLASIQHYIDDGMQDFNKVEGKYTLKTKTLDQDNDDTTITIDLNDHENPSISFIVDGEYSPDKVNNSSPSTLYMTDTLTFFNIDNTVIKTDFDDVEVLTEAEMIELFGGDDQ